MSRPTGGPAAPRTAARRLGILALVSVPLSIGFPPLTPALAALALYCAVDGATEQRPVSRPAMVMAVLAMVLSTLYILAAGATGIWLIWEIFTHVDE